MTPDEKSLNPANTVTLVRMVLIPVFLLILLGDWPTWVGATGLLAQLQPWIAAAVFGLLAATDGVDGYLARSRNEITTFGKFLDPLADKLLVTAALLALVELDVLPAWIAFVIIAREFIVSGLRMVASAEGLVIAASWYGKVKTVVQIIAILLFLIKDSVLLLQLGVPAQAFIQAVSWAVMGAAVVLTIMSMIDYFKHAADVLVGPWSRSDGSAGDVGDAGGDSAR
jgi:CDP-diacylglycerol--glycerol-3-phosphate 3-phosphatidyltransferase